MTEVNPKYQQIVTKAKELFWKFGVKRVSIEEICREAKVSKMTFYKFFSNKKELAIAIINNVLGKSTNDFKELVKSEIPFQEKVRKMFLIKHEAAKDISPEFIEDLYKNPNLGIHEEMEKIGHEVMLIFIDFLKDSQREGLIRNDIKIEFILAFQNSLAKLMEDKNLMKLYNEPIDFVMESMNFLFYGILTKKGRGDE